MTATEMIDAIQDAGFKVHEYHEEGTLCGYEIETWTDDLEIDMIHFLDFRDSPDGITPDAIRDEMDWVYVCFDADNETIEHWKAYEDLHKFGIFRIVQDFHDHKERLHDLAMKLGCI